MYIIIAGEEAGPISNKLGGIWSVIDAEARNLAKISLDEIVVAGPYFERLGQDWSPKSRITDLTGFEPVEDKKFLEVLDRTGIDYRAVKKEGEEGIKYVFFNAESCLSKRVSYKGSDMRLSDAVKAEAYNLLGLDSLKYENTTYGGEYTHYLYLSYAVSQLVSGLAAEDKVSLQCHEFPVFYASARLEKLSVPVKSVATFHATKVGRAWGARTFEKVLMGDATLPIDIQHGLMELEKLASYSDVVTFVSNNTRNESKLFYGIDGIVIRNGIELSANSVNWNKKTRNLQKMQSFLADSLRRVNGLAIEDKAIVPIFTISRLEVENKGYPDLLDSLVILDRVIKNKVDNKEIDEVKVFCILITALGPKDPQKLPPGFPISLGDEMLIGDELRLKRMIDERGLGVGDISRRNVCALLYPQWLSKEDGGFNMTLDEISSACVAGIFPSRYDPFLLTALEACSEACPVVLSKACGFSGAVRELQQQKGIYGGVILVDNIEQSYLQAITDYALGLCIIIDAFLRDWVKDRMMCDVAFMLAREMDWESPVRSYYEILKE
ncbi:MAG: glycogen synthase [Archaeoglobaceae archaeon]